MKRILIVLSFISYCLPIGLESLDLPSNAIELAKSGSGAGATENPYVNPAWDLSENNGKLLFSHNRWLGTIEGNSIGYHLNRKNFLGFRYWGVSNLELRSDVPSENPIGYFGLQTLLFSYGRSFNIDNFNFGLLTNFNFNKIINESMLGVSFNAGFKYKIFNHLSAGVVVKNLGYQFVENLRSSMNPVVVAGLDYRIFNPIYITYDFEYDIDDIIQNKLAVRIEFERLSFLISGQNDFNNHIELSTGFKLKYNKYMFAYGFRYINESLLGFPHFFHLGYVF